MLDLFGSISVDAAQAALEAVVVVAEQGQQIVLFNPAAERLFGRSAESVLGTPVADLLPEGMRAGHGAHVQQFQSSGVAELRMKAEQPLRGLRAGGTEFPVGVTISRAVETTDAGPRPCYVLQLRDLDQEQQQLSEYEEWKQRMRAIFDLVPIGIWVTDADLIVFANRCCAELFGSPDSNTLIGRSIYSLLSPESHATVRHSVQRALASRQPAIVADERILRLDGQVREVEIAVVSLPDHGQTAVQMVVTDITERNRVHREVERSRRELRRLAASLVDAREEERRRISRELHDELGQRLTALKMTLSTVEAPLRDRPASASLQAAIQMVDETVASTRRIAADLRPAMLDDLGLNAAIEWLASEAGRRMGIAVALRLDPTDDIVNDATATAVYRMVQEALTNIARHARATRASIELSCLLDELELVVEDNGVGLTEASLTREGSYGLMGMRERSQMLGGDFDIVAPPGGGTRIQIRLPLTPLPG
jgi:two-component system sensor histidine kinase UhpB